MKTSVFIGLMILFSGCQNHSSTPAFQKDLVKYLKAKQNPSSEKCDPAFVTIRDEELTVYCLPVENKDAVRLEVDSLTKQWAKENQKDFKNVRTRFTDEIMSGPAK